MSTQADRIGTNRNPSSINEAEKCRKYVYSKLKSDENCPGNLLFTLSHSTRLQVSRQRGNKVDLGDFRLLAISRKCGNFATVPEKQGLDLRFQIDVASNMRSSSRNALSVIPPTLCQSMGRNAPVTGIDPFVAVLPTRGSMLQELKRENFLFLRPYQ